MPPILLDTPLDVGELAPGGYTHAKVIDMNMNFQAGVVSLRVEYGIETGGVFTIGKAPGDFFEISGQEFLDTALSVSQHGETLEEHIKRKAYQLIMSKNARFQGTVV